MGTRCPRKETDTSYGAGETRVKNLPYGDSMSSSQPPAPAASEAEASTPLRAQLPRSIIVVLGAAGVVVVGAGLRERPRSSRSPFCHSLLTIAARPTSAPGHVATAGRAGSPRSTALVAAYAIVLALLAGTVICLVKLVDLLPKYAADSQELTAR